MDKPLFNRVPTNEEKRRYAQQWGGIPAWRCFFFGVGMLVRWIWQPEPEYAFSIHLYSIIEDRAWTGHEMELAEWREQSVWYNHGFLPDTEGMRKFIMREI